MGNVNIHRLAYSIALPGNLDEKAREEKKSKIRKELKSNPQRVNEVASWTAYLTKSKYSLNYAGQTMLHICCCLGDAEMCRELLELKADPNVYSTDYGNYQQMCEGINGNSDTQSLTALMAAAANGYKDIIVILVQNSRCDLNLKNKAGQTALQMLEEKFPHYVSAYLEAQKLRRDCD